MSHIKKKAFFFSIVLNNNQYKIFTIQPFQIFEFLEFLNYPKELVILEHNGKINNKLTLRSKYMKQDDKIEIITIVGGG
uniref:Thiamine biosynthesis protein n=1 Tax=Sargassum fusiforme TaxID=590727 RepID=A0A6M3Q464_SARFS|nr:thiamine biosynthesis protein [Sargassum fusiforme]QJC13540.1 thiamine biosynthesis protein [Sargassum fusiforme]